VGLATCCRRVDSGRVPVKMCARHSLHKLNAGTIKQNKKPRAAVDSVGVSIQPYTAGGRTSSEPRLPQVAAASGRESAAARGRLRPRGWLAVRRQAQRQAGRVARGPEDCRRVVRGERARPCLVSQLPQRRLEVARHRADLWLRRRPVKLCCIA